MGKQNTLSGGFYGKVGAFIGQRWHNIRTIKAYTKPSNPRTEKQQANRRVFADYTKNAQIGQGMNYNAPCFNGIDNSEWGIRMACASQLKKSGQSGLNLIPLFPYGYVPQFSIKGITLEETQGGMKAIFSVEGELPTTERDLSILVSTKESENGAETWELYRTVLNKGTAQTFTIEGINVQELNEYTKMLIVSNDDKENNGEMVYGSEQTVKVPQIVEKAFDISVIGVQRDGKTFTIIFAEPFVDGVYEIGQMQVKGISNGEEKTLTFTPATLANNNGFFSVSFTQETLADSEILAFPQGSSLLVEKIKVSADRIILTSEGQSAQAFDNSDLTRPFYAEEDTDFTPTKGDEILFFKQNLQNVISSSVKVDFYEMLDFMAWEKTPVYIDLAVRNGRGALTSEYPLSNFLPTEGNATIPTLGGTARGVTYEGRAFDFTYKGTQENYLLVESSLPMDYTHVDDNGFGIELNVPEMEGANWQNGTQFSQMCDVFSEKSINNIQVNCTINGMQISMLVKNLREVVYENNKTLSFWFDVGINMEAAENITLVKTSTAKNVITIRAKELGLPVAQFTI